jgi:hypothetical protein
MHFWFNRKTLDSSIRHTTHGKGGSSNKPPEAARGLHTRTHPTPHIITHIQISLSHTTVELWTRIYNSILTLLTWMSAQHFSKDF